MRIYLASWFYSKDRVARQAQELKAIGAEITARWMSETVPHTVSVEDLPDEYHRETAIADVEDILRADTLVLFTPTREDLANKEIKLSSWARGGRHFESGFFYAFTMFDPDRRFILCGPRENIFHWLDGQGAASLKPNIIHFETWEQ